MEANTPLLDSPDGKLNGNGHRLGLSRHNSVNTLKNDFISRLPDQLRSAIDPESPYDVDFSEVPNLTPGITPFVLCYISFFWGGGEEQKGFFLVLGKRLFCFLVRPRILAESRSVI